MELKSYMVYLTTVSLSLLIFSIFYWHYIFTQCSLTRVVMQCNCFTSGCHICLSSLSLPPRFFYFVHTLFCIYCIWWLQWSAIKPGGLGTERCPPPHKQHSHRNRYRSVFTIVHAKLNMNKELSCSILIYIFYFFFLLQSSIASFSIERYHTDVESYMCNKCKI